MTEQRFVFGPYVFDPGRAALSHDNEPVPIGRRAASVLQALLEANGEVITKARLLDLAWPGAIVEESNLSVQIAALRKALKRGHGAVRIDTVARVGYRFAGPVTVCAGAERSTGTRASRPSIAVLPFDNLSGDPQQEYFADGVAEDVIAALSRFRWFFVIARTASFAFRGRAVAANEIAHLLGVRYVLTGSVRKSGDRVRISTQLVDGSNATQLWAGRYEFQLEDIFSVQDDITAQVVGAIEPELLKAESASAARGPRAGRNITGWDLVHQGTWFFHQVTQPTHVRARELFRQARKADPQLAEAHSWLGRVSAGIVAYGWSGDPASDLREGVEAALRAVEIDDTNPYAHYALAITSVYAGQFGQAMRAAEMAIELSPAFALGHLVLGMARLFSGNSAEAISPLERGLLLNPHDPQNFVWHNLLALACLFEGQHERALQCAIKALKIRPGWRLGTETAACCYVVLGRASEASECAQRLAKTPAPVTDALTPLRLANPAWRDELRALLSRA